MSVYFQKPQIFGPEQMFLFWAENLCKEKPHLIIKNQRTSSKPTELWYEVKHELEYLNKRNLVLDARIQELEVIDKDIKRFTPATEEIFEMKKEIMNNKYKIKELEKLPGDKKEMIMDSTLFKKILTLYNKKASDAIIAGKTLNLHNKLGYSQIRKIIPPTRSERIDWKESYEFKKELEAKGELTKSKETPTGSNWLVYKIQSYYLRWAWVKRSNRECTVKNNRVYAFYPTASSSTAEGKEKVPGNKAKLAAAQKADSLLHTRYTVIELKNWKKLKA
jgi:hypothetical protein